jgi:hypothetical protein
MKKGVKWVGLGILAVFISIQLIQPERTNPPVDESKTVSSSLNVPPEVRAVLERSCYDCHSNNTRWPWYSHVAPVSWLTARDVKKGRTNLNFSTWGDYKKRRQINKLDQISDQLRENEMPVKPYRLMHPSAVLSKAEIDLVTGWAEKVRDHLLDADSTSTTEKK